MTLQQFRARMLRCALAVAKTLCEASISEDIKLEPEQTRKNASTIITILLETEDFLDSIKNDCSGSN